MILFVYHFTDNYKKIKSNSIDPDQTPWSGASNLGAHCFFFSFFFPDFSGLRVWSPAWRKYEISLSLAISVIIVYRIKCMMYAAIIPYICTIVILS